MPVPAPLKPAALWTISWCIWTCEFALSSLALSWLWTRALVLVSGLWYACGNTSEGASSVSQTEGKSDFSSAAVMRSSVVLWHRNWCWSVFWISDSPPQLFCLLCEMSSRPPSYDDDQVVLNVKLLSPCVQTLTMSVGIVVKRANIPTLNSPLVHDPSRQWLTEKFIKIMTKE